MQNIWDYLNINLKIIIYNNRLYKLILIQTDSEKYPKIIKKNIKNILEYKKYKNHFIVSEWELIC